MAKKLPRSEMKVPSRPAPPPPVNSNLSSQKLQGNYLNDLLTLDDPFDIQIGQMGSRRKPPPRPPPPKSKTIKNKSDKFNTTALISDKTIISSPTQLKGSTLIDWMPSISPTFTKSSSDSGVSTPLHFHNGSVTESGFEDDFDPFGSTNTTPGTISWGESTDPFSPVKKCQQNSDIFDTNNTFVNSKNEKNMTFKTPTIIRPTMLSMKPSRPPPPKSSSLLTSTINYNNYQRMEEEDESSWSRDSSPPMPQAPPPPPPPEAAQIYYPPVPPRIPSSQEKSEVKHPHCVAQYDYEATHPDDLSFKIGDVITLTSRVNEEWLKGRLLGREGIFPENYVNIIEPLERMENNSNNAEMIAIAVYPFHAETWDDLELEEGDEVKVLKRLNEDWLYGEVNGKRGQFPECYVQDMTDFAVN